MLAPITTAVPPMRSGVEVGVWPCRTLCGGSGLVGGLIKQTVGVVGAADLGHDGRGAGRVWRRRSVSSPKPAKLRYTPPFANGSIVVHVERTQLIASVSSVGSCQDPSMLMLNRAERCGYAVSFSPTLAMAPPKVRMKMTDSGEGRPVSAATRVSMSSSERSSIMWDFQ